MEVQTVTMDAEAAAKAFREYRAAFMADRNRIDGELMRGYKALAEGKTLISLSEAIATAGADEMGRPKLAIARADEARISMTREADGRVNYDPWLSSVRSPDRLFELPAETLPPLEETWSPRPDWVGRWFAALPFIPPQYRPPNAMTNYHLLWEAEWRRARGPQRLDPILLRRVGGDVFAVVAAWDLTELEKLVLVR